MLLINKKILSAMLLNTADLWQKNTSLLSEIDSRFGDGDHGVAIDKIARAIKESVQSWGEESIKIFIGKLASRVMSIGGGSAGPLYGTLIEGLAAPLSDEAEIDAKTLKAMFVGSKDALFEVTKARCGDKTMMDAIIPAVEAAEAADENISDILAAAAKAAAEGAKNSESMVSKFGRARSYGEATLGTKDAGALSAALFYEGLTLNSQ